MASAMTLAGGGTALAQTVPARNVDASQLEEVVVTAQKREENLQSVPISVSAVTSAAIERYHSTDLQSLNGVVPNLQVKASPNGTLSARYTLRGLGIVETDPFAGMTVGIVIDGVVLGASSISLADNFDVERIEVLRGPQGTLFGASTTGGVINIITKQPTGVFGGEGVVTAGNYKRLNGSVAVNFPIIDGVLAGKVAAGHLGRDGFYTDRSTGERIDNTNENYLRAYLRFTPNDNFDATLKLTWDKIRDGMTPIINLAVPGDRTYVPGLVKKYVYVSDTGGLPNLNNADQYSQTLTANWNSNFGQITSITSFLRFNFHRWQDYDGTPLFDTHGWRDVNQHQFSQEVRDVFHPMDNLEVLVGGYYSQRHYHLTQNSLTNGALVGSEGFSTQDQWVKQLAAFGQAYWDVTPRLRVQAGLRYTWENNHAYNFVENRLNHVRTTGFTADAEESWGQVGGKVGLDYKITDGTMAYGYYAHGFKSGGFNGRIAIPAAIGPFGPENLDTFEGGIKSDLFDRRLRINLAAFYNKYKDMQVPQVAFFGLVATSSILNAASANTYGAELETSFVPFRGMTLSANIAYLEAQYDKFSVGANCGRTPPTGCVVYDNTEMPHAPKWSTSLNANYVFDIAGGQGDANFQYNWVADSWTNYTHVPTEHLTDIGLVNANIGWGPEGQAWKVSLWSRNLLNHKYIAVARYVPPLWTDAQWGTPREVGVDFSFKF